MKDDLNTYKEDWETKHMGTVYETCPAGLYHYTTLETMWSILSSDLLYARHVRFSNDSEEYHIGKEMIEEFCSGHSITHVDDCYMICFSMEKDCLSQWREYARGGVALTFDFRDAGYYTIRCNRTVEKQNQSNHLPEEKSPYFIPAQLYADEIGYYCTYAEPVKVKYLTGYNDIIQDLNQIRESVGSEEEMRLNNSLKAIIPYIKHVGFHEEKEARLIFTTDKLFGEYQVDYLEDRGVYKPYIRVEFGNAEEKESDDCLIQYGSGVPGELLTELQNYLKDKYSKIKASDRDGKKEIKINTRLEKLEKQEDACFYIGSCKRQKQVFEWLDHYVSNSNLKGRTKAKIWCRGHLPIRQILVGPAHNKEEIKESIQHKLQQIYWLKYVDVDTSSIPYRQKLDR